LKTLAGGETTGTTPAPLLCRPAPAGQNPPNGAILDYYISSSPGQDVTLDIPTPVMATAYEGYCKELASAAQSWNELMKTDLANLNGALAKQDVGAVAGVTLTGPSCK
jgi:hypothetical protein